MENALTAANFRKGFLIDEELMAGVSEDAEQPGHFAAFVLNHASAEYLGYKTFADLNLALSSINSIPRSWKYEASGGCEGGCDGSEDGPCGKGPCQQSCQSTGVCEIG